MCGHREPKILGQLQNRGAKPFRFLRIAQQLIRSRRSVRHLRRFRRVERRHQPRPADVVEKRRVGDTVEPGEQLRAPIETSQRLPGLPVRLLREVSGQIAVAAQPVQRGVDRRVCPLDDLFRRGAVALADFDQQPAFVAPGGDHRLTLRPRRERRNVPHAPWTQLRDI